MVIKGAILAAVFLSIVVEIPSSPFAFRVVQLDEELINLLLTACDVFQPEGTKDGCRHRRKEVGLSVTQDRAPQLMVSLGVIHLKEGLPLPLQ